LQLNGVCHVGKKTIILCFDGTKNHPRDAKQEREWFGTGEIKDNGITNILKLHALLGGNLANAESNLDATKNQRSFYHSGIGTYGRKVQRMFNAGFASSNLDIATIMHHASEDLKANYNDGDDIVIIGFSRGAAVARKFASRLPRFLPAIQDKVGDQERQKVIKLLAVFDTVASIGVPNLDAEDKPQSDVVFEDGTISPFVREAVHLVSLDDRRIAFHPVLMNKESRITEVWFAGAHSDVGGGFWRDGLSDVALEFMKFEMEKRAGLTFVNEDSADFVHLKHDEYKIDFEDLDIKPNVKGESHQQDRWGPVALLTLEARRPRVNIDDEESSEPILMHRSVIDRIQNKLDYRPKALKGVKYRILEADDSSSPNVFNGLYQHI
jgi:uncharacterized protein (DUF2235 family)